MSRAGRADALPGVRRADVPRAAPSSRAGWADPLDEGAAAEPARGARLATISRAAEAVPQGSRRLPQRFVALPRRTVRHLHQCCGHDRPGAGAGGPGGPGPDGRPGRPRVPASPRHVLPGARRPRPGLGVRRHGGEPGSDRRCAGRADRGSRGVRPGTERGHHESRADRGGHAGGSGADREPGSRARVRRALHRHAGRDRALAGRQPRHASRAHDDPRGHGSRILRTVSGAHRVGGGGEAARLLRPARQPLRALGRRAGLDGGGLAPRHGELPAQADGAGHHHRRPRDARREAPALPGAGAAQRVLRPGSPRGLVVVPPAVT